ncbi:LOW QUALITY PROTEIN: hypothetical protein KUTeg_020090 [Tegillarca granosa]|uniref:Uncharacterized protein n=1 Tax=Tegillarca granosa TaxID=220873 RepID=A0ABQ9E6R4_TEGGR|nr:LOW QUALITY PROTEIN: hypothetical protein KUTeg_020090 [Tegillarca granosa]
MCLSGTDVLELCKENSINRHDGYLYSHCFNKLKRLSKLEDDFRTGCEKFDAEKAELKRQVHISEVVATTSNKSTPSKNNKRKIVQTPTPKKFKVSKPTATTPRQNFTPIAPKNVRISVQYASQVKTANITNDDIKKICKALVNRRSFKDIAKLCAKKHYSLLRNSDTLDLLSVNFDNIANELKEKSCLFFRVLNSISNAANRDGINPAVVFCGASLLRLRNPSLGRLHHAVCLMLDQGGTTDEHCAATKTCKQLLDKLAEKDGICVSLYIRKCGANSFIVSFESHSVTLNSENIPTSLLPFVNFDMLPACDNLKLSLPVYVNSGHLHVIANASKLCTSEEVYSVSSTTNQVSTIDNGSYGDPLHSSEFLKCIGDLSKRPDTVLFDIIGDNFDLTISPNYMTSEKQRQSLHWFLYLALEKRVVGNHLPNNGPKANIAKLPSSTFIPSIDEIESLKSDFVYHMCKTAVKYLKFLQPFGSCLPQY